MPSSMSAPSQYIIKQLEEWKEKEHFSFLDTNVFVQSKKHIYSTIVNCYIDIIIAVILMPLVAIKVYSTDSK